MKQGAYGFIGHSARIPTWRVSTYYNFYTCPPYGVQIAQISGEMYNSSYNKVVANLSKSSWLLPVCTSYWTIRTDEITNTHAQRWGKGHKHFTTRVKTTNNTDPILAYNVDVGDTDYKVDKLIKINFTKIRYRF